MIIYDINMKEIKDGDTLTDGRELHKVSVKNNKLMIKINRKTYYLKDLCKTVLDDTAIVILDYMIYKRLHTVLGGIKI